MKAKKFLEGSFELIMINDRGIMVNATASYVGYYNKCISDILLYNSTQCYFSIKKHTHRFESGKSKTLIYYAPEPRIVVIQEARLKWLHTTHTVCLFCKTAVYVDRMIVKVISVQKLW